MDNIGRKYVSKLVPLPMVGNVDEIMLNAVAKLEEEVKELKLSNEALAVRIGELEASL